MSDIGMFKGSEDLLKATKLIKCVFLPLERKNGNVNAFLMNYTKTVRESIDQLTGSRAIDIPSWIEPNDETALASSDTMKQYSFLLEEWNKKIKERLMDIDSNNPDKKQAFEIIEYWRSRSSILSTLYQDLNKPIVQTIKKMFNSRNHVAVDNTYQEFDQSMKVLIQANAEAKDNSKFLNTLERQFKILQSKDLANIEQCLSSLLNGLRLVFIISRYYKQDTKMSNLLTIIANEICDSVKENVNIRELLKPKADVNYEEQLEEAAQAIIQGMKVLKQWIDLYQQTKEQLESDGGDHWEFPVTEIKGRPQSMHRILEKFLHMTTQLQKLLALLGPKLKSVTGNTDSIDELVKSAKGLVGNLDLLPYDFFAKEEKCDLMYSKFKNESENIQKEATKLIEETFQVLRSSESGFEFLQKFKVDSLEEVANNLQMRYGDVLDNYRKELNKNKSIFERDKEHPKISKNQPPVAGAIAWKKSILRRIKAPIIRFIEKEHVLNEDDFRMIKEDYKEFFDKLDAFQDKQLEQWGTEVNNQANIFLSSKILSSSVDKNGEVVFKVNFPTDSRILINEAKYLDRMVPNVTKKILNIALQEEEYYRYMDKIEKMLREYNNTINSLKDVEKNLLAANLKILRDKLQPGVDSYYLNSLGINDFISGCMIEIKTFNDKRNKVEEKTRNIEDIIRTIESAKIMKEYDFATLIGELRDGKDNDLDKDNVLVLSEDQKKKKEEDILNNYVTLQEFVTYFEKPMIMEVDSLADKYLKIGSAMLPQIAMAIFDSPNGDKHPQMRYYYYYWERRVYNALVKLVTRALLTFKNLLEPPRRDKMVQIPLFKIVAELSNQNVTTNPNSKEIENTLNNFKTNIIKASARFPRWKDGTCICVERPAGDKSNEKDFVQHTFYEDIEINTIIKDVSAQINNAVTNTLLRTNLLTEDTWEIPREEGRGDEENEGWADSLRKGLFNSKHRMRAEKHLEKHPSTMLFETYIEILHHLIKEYESKSPEGNAGFIKIDFTRIKKTFESQAKECIRRIASSLIKIIDKDADELNRVIMDYYHEIRKGENNREDVKKCLNTLTKIRDSTEEKEFEIAELVQKCDILHKYQDQKYGFEFDMAKYNSCVELGKYWSKLLYKAKQKHDSIKSSLQMFKKQTQSEVIKLQEKIEKLHEGYVKNGPGALETSLDDGVEKMKYYRKEVDDLNAAKTETVKMQKLFGMDVTPFPKLVEVDHDLKKLDTIYVFYIKIKAQIEELSRKTWERFDFKDVEETKKQFSAKVREFNKNSAIRDTLVFKKLEAAYQEFDKPLKTIGEIKSNVHFGESHWERLLKLIDKPTEGINFSQITLQQVMALNLHEYQDRVDEIKAAAQSEFKNRADVITIEEFWRNAAFEVTEHKRDKGGYKIKIPEEIKLQLDEHLNSLQAIEGSKYAGTALKNEVKKWMDSLIKIQETTELWVKVQTKWLYLEGIYVGNEDIKAQLSKEAKNFEALHQKFKNLNEKVSKNPNIKVNCVVNDTTYSQLENLAVGLDRSQKTLKEYLNSKKKVFPRFYFISDDDLLSILGSSDVNSIQSQLLKLFDNVKTLGFDKGKMVQMFSEEGESFSFFEPFKPEGAVEVWMTKVEEIMVDTLRKLTKEGVYMYAKMDKHEWMKKYIGMIVLVGRQIWWTWRVEDVFRKVKEGDKYAMKKEANFQTEELKDLVNLVRSDLESIDPSGRFRRKLNNLIIIDVHDRDIVDTFVRDSILDAKEFEWESQLRFYWRNNINDIQIDQCTGHFRYGYEYQGLTTRLVITPLTDRCVMTLTTALTFNLGGAPAGPAGTGKTETCKDLGKNLALRTVVTNCGENFDVLAMGTNFSGLCQTGFWGVFDEFNRILPEVLSVISTQISEIQKSLVQGKGHVELLEEEIAIKPTVGIFVTMNPGYEGRSELPDNLKALFRPVTMIVPDLKIICENMLMSEGFQEARVLAKKMTVLYQLSKEQLSKQCHYDFGLRALKSVLVMAGALKRGSPDLAEEDVLMRALKDMNVPKFVYEDVSLFQGLLNDLFPGRSVEAISHKDFNQRILECQAKKDLQELQIQASKVIQLMETMETRHASMVVGPTGAGKTTIIELLKDARTIPNVRNVVSYIMNPKAQGMFELYGVLDPQTRNWTDGVLSKVFKHANEELPERGPTDKGPKEEIRWILFDGDVDAIWIENMNSVMDDSKLLTLSNGDRIKLKNFCKLLFEVFDLGHASPATISRSGMVYIDPKNLSYEHFYNSWKNKLFKNTQMEKENKEQLLEVFTENYSRFIKPLAEYIIEGRSSEDTGALIPVDLSIARTGLNLVQQFTNIMDCMLPEDLGTLINDGSRIENMFVYSCLWSFGSCIKNESVAEGFVQYLKGLVTEKVPDKSLYDYTFEGNSWVEIKKYKVTAYQPPEDRDFSKILVPTIDTVKFNHLLNLLMSKAKPTLFVGEPGTAKTVIIKNYLSSLKIDSFTILNMNFSSRTDSMEVQRNIETVTDKRRPGIYGPKGNKKLIIFIDELHMPKVDPYGTQQPIALLKFLIDKKLMYERGGGLERREYRDCQYVAALLPPGGGYNSVDPRFLSLFNCITIQFPKEENIRTIYHSILWEHLRTCTPAFPKEFEDISRDITSGTYKLFQRITEALPRSPSKFHYIFNLRDLSRVYQGLLRAQHAQYNTKDKLIRLWKNECMRVFTDRLVTEEDKKTVQNDIINNIIKDSFGEEVLKKIQAEPDYLYGDFKDTDPLEPELEDPKIYQNLENYDQVKKKCEELLGCYNEENPEMNLVLFNDALDHLVRLIRILRFPQGNAMLVGVGGSGKQSLTKLGTFIINSKLFTVQVKKSYGESAFRKDLLEFYSESLYMEENVFMFTDAQIVEEGFLELINTMLTVGVINNLFDAQTKTNLNNAVSDMLKKSGSSDEMWEIVCDVFKKNLHIVLCMSPAGEALRVRCRNFPGLISNTTIDWFFPWPAEALKNVAEVNLEELNFEPEMFEKVVNHFVRVHLSIPQFAAKYQLLTRRRVYNTPKNYLDFLRCYIQKLDENKKLYKSIIDNYERGLEKLVITKAQIEEMKKVIEVEKVEVEASKAEVKKIEADIKKKTVAANEENKAAQIKEADLKIQAEEIKKKKEEADKLYADAEPELAEAKKKLSELKQKDISDVASYSNPATMIVEAGKLLQMLKINSKCDPVGLEWSTCKACISDPNIKNDMYKYDVSKCKESQIKNVKKQIEYIKSELGGNSLEKSSVAMNSFFNWVCSTVNFYQISKNINELRTTAEKLTKQKKAADEDLAQTKKRIKELDENVKKLEQDLAKNDKKLKELTKKLEEMTTTLNNAIKLLDGLAAEQIRWTKDKEQKSEKIQYLEAECLLCASFLSYFGPFDQEFRKQMTTDYTEDLLTKSLKLGDDFRVEELLTSDVEVTKWNSEGLPADELSVQNGILTNQATRYPLCIDPQLQAIKWIKKKEKNIAKYTTNFNDPELVRKLENAFREGDSILIENVGEEIDPIIDNILLRKYFTIGGIVKVKIGDRDVDVPMGSAAASFKLYLTSKLPNPNYSPEIMGKTSVINYTVNLNGLAEQLLTDVIINENPEQNEKRNELIITTSENMSEIDSLQKSILNSLVNAQKDIIKDVALIQTLQTSKTKSKQIEEDLVVATKTKAILEAARQDYQPIAMRGSVLFFCMKKLSAISDMYEYSLSSYREVFKRSLRDSQPDNVVATRIKIIIEKLTQNVYDYITLGIFKNHRRTFTFQMVLMIQEEQGKLNRRELNFFLKGNTKLGDAEGGKIVDWLTDNNSKDIEDLITIDDTWKTFANELRDNEAAWKEWFDRETPEEFPLPAPFDELVKTKFQLLLILRVMRPDRISLGIDRLIVDFFDSDQYIRVPVLKEKWLLNQISNQIPVIYILSPGADPTSFIAGLATKEGFTGKKFMAQSLGQGMEKIAFDLVENATARGYWVLLQNCDLLPKCIKEIERRLEVTDPNKIHPDFRLWMTTQPTTTFPLGILQKALKIVTEPPAGIKNNMESIIARIGEDQVVACPHYAFRPLTYVIVFLHAIVLDRAKYGKIGWNVTYDFNYSDFQISFRLLNLYLNKSLENKDDTIPWESLKYLIGEAMYGGRVTDEFDRRVLMTYLDEYMGDFLFDKNHEFFFAEATHFKYNLPTYADRDQLAHVAAALPNTDSPVVFGLNPNAEITYYTNDAKSLWNNFLKMESVGSSSISPQEKDRIIDDIARNLMEKTIYDVDPVSLRMKRIEEVKELKPTDVVLFQEMDRFKLLVNKIQVTLNSLQRALSGKIGMNAELDELAASLYNSYLPKSWAKLAPATEKNLGSWINHFLKRRAQYEAWYEQGEPTVMWLSGLHIPESYLTALVQTACRAKGWALDKSTLFTTVTDQTRIDKISKPEFGCFVTGLYLEGVSWDIERNCLRAQHAKELIHEMPIMKINPVEVNKLKLKDSMKIPVYVTQNRRNAKGVGHVFDADLSTTEHPSHWILQGAALVLNTDE